jgi:hypothetical protein
LINAFFEFEDFGDYNLDFIEPRAQQEDLLLEAEWEWWENYLDGWSEEMDPVIILEALLFAIWWAACIPSTVLLCIF